MKSTLLIISSLVLTFHGFSQDQTIKNTLDSIGSHLAMINSITEWDSILVRELDDACGGADARFYFHQGGVKKIVTRHHGSMAQGLSEYYVKEKNPIFVLHRMTEFNRPASLDSTAMNESEDDQFFDLSESEVFEDRFYFSSGKLIKVHSDGDCGAPFSAGFMQEQEKELLRSTQELLQLLEE